MKIISIGTDRKLFEEGSVVLERQKEYASKLEELHIVVFSLRKHNLIYKKIDNLHIYSTNSSSRFLYIKDAIKICKKIAKEGNFIITTQDPFETGLVGYSLKKKLNLPLQLQIHTDFLSPYFKSSFLNQIRVVIAKFLIPKADGLRVVSSVISDSIKNKFPNLKARVDILPIFVDIHNFMNREVSLSDKMFPFTIFMASRLTEEKRIDVGLEVLKKVLDGSRKNDGMVIVGSGPERDNISKKIDELGISNNVKVLEWKKDIVSLYKSADVFLLTSDFEGYGMTLIEAAAAGCPIVTTNVGIAKTELFKDGINSYVCPVGDVDCLSKSLVDLITDEKKRKSFSLNMRDSIKSITITKEEYVSRYVALLQNLSK